MKYKAYMITQQGTFLVLEQLTLVLKLQAETTVHTSLESGQHAVRGSRSCFFSRINCMPYRL